MSMQVVSGCHFRRGKQRFLRVAVNWGMGTSGTTPQVRQPIHTLFHHPWTKTKFHCPLFLISSHIGRDCHTNKTGTDTIQVRWISRSYKHIALIRSSPLGGTEARVRIHGGFVDASWHSRCSQCILLSYTCHNTMYVFFLLCVATLSSHAWWGIYINKLWLWSSLGRRKVS